MRDMETLLAKGLSEGEIRDLKRYLDQMLSNLDVDVECPKNSFCGGMKIEILDVVVNKNQIQVKK